MDLPLNKELNSNIENVEKMAQIVDDEDVRLFLVNKPKTNKKNTANFGKYYYPKENIAEYFKSNYKQDIDARKIEKFLENGILDNILFNFMFSRGMDLKNSLIDVNRAYTLIKKMKQDHNDVPEKVPEQSLNEQEKWEVVCEFMKKHPQLFLQAIPASERKAQEIGLPTFNKNNDLYTSLPRSTKQRLNQKFRTVGRDNIFKIKPNNASGKIKNVNKIRNFDRNSASPAVPLPTHSRFTSHPASKLSENIKLK